MRHSNVKRHIRRTRKGRVQVKQHTRRLRPSIRVKNYIPRLRQGKETVDAVFFFKKEDDATLQKAKEKAEKMFPGKEVVIEKNRGAISNKEEEDRRAFEAKILRNIEKKIAFQNMVYGEGGLLDFRPTPTQEDIALADKIITGIRKERDWKNIKKEYGIQNIDEPPERIIRRKAKKPNNINWEQE